MFGIYFLIFSTCLYKSHTDKIATDQTVLLIFQKTIRFMWQFFLVSFDKNITYIDITNIYHNCHIQAIKVDLVKMSQTVIWSLGKTVSNNIFLNNSCNSYPVLKSKVSMDLYRQMPLIAGPNKFFFPKFTNVRIKNPNISVWH